MNTPNGNARRREDEIYRVTIMGSVVNLLLLLFKFFAGATARSAAMMADAVHSLSDFVTDVVVLFFVRISAKPEDEGHDFGHGKYETLATAVIGLLLLVVGFGIFWNGATAVVAYARGAVLPRPGMLALWAALLSIVSKEALYWYTVVAGRRLRSPSVVANAWHHRSDALSSVGTAAGIAGAILLGERWRVLDPLAAVVVSFFIMRVAVKLLRPCLDELLERSLPAAVESEMEQIILAEPGVSAPHHLRTRRIGNYYAIDVHIRMDGDLPLREAHRATAAIEARLRARFGSGTLINIHVEPLKAPCAAGPGEG